MDPLLQAFVDLESTHDVIFRTESIQRALIGLMRDLRGIAKAANNRKTYGFLFDWIYPHMPLLLKAIMHWAESPEVTTPLLKFIAEFVLNKSQRLNFDTSSPNGILLFREVSKLIISYGSRNLSILNHVDMYTFKYKGTWICLTILSRALAGSYVNFGVFEVYGDRALVDSLDIALKMVSSIPLMDVLVYRKLTGAYFAFLEALLNTHITYILNQDFTTFALVVGSIQSGLKLPDASIMSQILKFMFEIVLFEDSGNQCSLSGPMLSLILISEEMFTNMKSQVLASQPVYEQQRLSQCFDKLMENVTRSLNPKNREKFTNNLATLRTGFRSR